MSTAASPRPPLVIIVDDDTAVRTALEFTLELEGFEVATCGSGEALLLCELPASHACLVIDERLPGISGLAALGQLRTRQVALPAILVTSNPSPATRAAAKAIGTPILEKPLFGDALSAAIRAALAA